MSGRGQEGQVDVRGRLARCRRGVPPMRGHGQDGHATTLVLAPPAALACRAPTAPPLAQACGLGQARNRPDFDALKGRGIAFRTAFAAHVGRPSGLDR